MKISKKSYSENSTLKLARLCARKSLIYLDLLKVNGCWLEVLYLSKFLLSKYLMGYDP